MKKFFVLIISTILVITLVSCSGNTELPTVTNAETTSETSTETPVSSNETNDNTLVKYEPAYRSKGAATLSRQDSDYIIGVIKNSIWNEGTPDCLYDVIFTINEKTLGYHVSCGTFSDFATEKSLELTKSQMGKVNDMLGPLGYLYGEDEPVDLSVRIDTGKVLHGENFVMTARATNNTGETIYVSLPSGTPDMHFEIDVIIEDESGKRFVDLDTQGKLYTCDMKIISVKNGETITQVMNMAPGYLLDGSTYPFGEEIKYFPGGTYKGTATFIWHDSFNPETFEYGNEHRKVIEFDVPVLELKSDTADSFR